MNTRFRFPFLLACLPLLTIACMQDDTVSLEKFSIKEIANPASPGSAEPNLVLGDDGKVYLSWIENTGETGHSLRYAVKDDDDWSQSYTIATGDDWFVNWADFPVMAAFEDGALAAHWLQKSGKGSYAYNVMVAFSDASEGPWSKGIVPHRDGTETEHGFVSMLPWDDGNIFTVWLDGRKFAKNSHGQDGNGAPANEMTLRFAMINMEGLLSSETILDERVCDCCPTSAVRTPNGALVVYRDRSEKEIRDIGILRYQDGRWSEPRILYRDNWEIAGCPVNGPAIAAQGTNVAVAWFTWANEIARVKVIFSNDDGKTFGAPVVVDDGEPVGRVDAVMLPDGSALVSWLETISNNAELRVRRVQPDGTREASIMVAESSKSRASGMPRMINNGNKIFLAWTEPGKPSKVRTAVATLK